MLDFSFIIPAYNEELVIPTTLSLIKRYVPAHYTSEILLVDNGSTDSTVERAKESGVVVLVNENATIGELRNIGAKASQGKVLVFLDADVYLTESWRENIATVISFLDKESNTITGSKCSVDEDSSWIESAWFSEYQESKEVTHIGTGHMITSRKCFFLVGGFDNELKTGEDYDFCRRARISGALILNNSKLKVIHKGAPNNLLDFVKREAWHGLGDTVSITSIIRSKVAIATFVFIMLHVGLIATLIFSPIKFEIISLHLFLILMLCMYSARKRNSHQKLYQFIKTTLLFYFYYIGRSISIICRFIPLEKSCRHQ